VSAYRKWICKKNTSATFYSGARKLLGKQSISSLHIQDNLLFVGGTSIDETTGKMAKEGHGHLGPVSHNGGLDGFSKKVCVPLPVMPDPLYVDSIEGCYNFHDEALLNYPIAIVDAG
ncbi:hypothetical protein Tco_1498317, partial [Tanacetum coccineum]